MNTTLSLQQFLIYMSLIVYFAYTGSTFAADSYTHSDSDISTGTEAKVRTDASMERDTSDKNSLRHSDSTQSGNINMKEGNSIVPIMMGLVTFDTNSDVVNSTVYPEIEIIVKTLLDNLGTMVIVAGHADSAGNALYNRNLSMRRALAVKKLLIENGVAFNRIATIGFGDLNPIASNDIITDRNKNRRVELSIIPTENIIFQPADNADAVMKDRSYSATASQGAAASYEHGTGYNTENDASEAGIKEEGNKSHPDTYHDDQASRNSTILEESEASADFEKESLSELNNQVDKLIKEGKLFEANNAAENALIVANAKHGSQGKARLKAKDNIAHINYIQGKYEKAAFYYKELLKTLIKSSKKDSLYVAVTMSNLAAIHTFNKDYFRARQYYIMASEILRKKYKYHPLRATIMDSLASICRKPGQYCDEKRFKELSKAIRANNPSIDFIESYSYKKCKSMAIEDQEVCEGINKY